MSYSATAAVLIINDVRPGPREPQKGLAFIACLR